jgi:hypothetical protein
MFTPNLCDTGALAALRKTGFHLSEIRSPW